jgi:hypothetical protein
MSRLVSRQRHPRTLAGEGLAMRQQIRKALSKQPHTKVTKAAKESGSHPVGRDSVEPKGGAQ